ncbi:sodium:solute symporter family transporter [Geminisphaera colitermitum]|uniref:sodium:solute symporter family transporter n=1 Tax=Geminisphaera colitermitum TaxID=1148786 RepID=UPI000158CCFB|nr:sodium transporter [Geminisphaera colitermitum]
MAIHLPDLVVLALYFTGTVVLGLRFSRRSKKSTEAYFLGGRSFPGWAIGISLIGSMISSVTFIAYPADSFKTAWVRFLPNLAFPLVVLLSAWLFIPFFRRGTISSAYQYLSIRFGPSVSTYAAAVFLLSNIFRIATITYLVAMLLSAVVNIPVGWSILLAGGITAIYVAKGGMEAVVWTEVMQTMVLICGALFCIGFVIWIIPGGLGQIVTEAWESGKLSFRDLNQATGELEPIKSGITLTDKTGPMLVLVGFVQYLAGKLDQITVQRWCAAKSAREASKSMVVLGIASVPVWALFMFLGTCLWVYFQHHPTGVSQAVLAGQAKAEEILPHFIVTVLPAGAAGLVIAAALAAAMSTLGGCISAVSMVWVRDLYQPHLVKGRDDRHYLRVGFIASIVASGLMMGGAWLFYKSNSKTFADLALILSALMGGGIPGAFLLGMLTRIADLRAVITGIIANVLFTTWALSMQFGLTSMVFDLYYTAILGNVITFGVGYLSARLRRVKPDRDLTNLTVWDQSSEKLV